eukprot:jgi/Undpi1/2097/HiC_scaffold_12.g05483.m1
MNQPSAGPSRPADAVRSERDAAVNMMYNCSASSRRRAAPLEPKPQWFRTSKPVPRAVVQTKHLNSASAIDRVGPRKTYASRRTSSYAKIRTPMFGPNTTAAQERKAPATDAPFAPTSARPVSSTNILTPGSRWKREPSVIAPSGPGKTPASLENVQRKSESVAGIGIDIGGRVDGGGGRGVEALDKALVTSVAAGQGSGAAQKATKKVAAARKSTKVTETRVMGSTAAPSKVGRQALETRRSALESRVAEGEAAKGKEESVLTRKALPLASAAGTSSALASRPAAEKAAEGGGKEAASRKALVAGAGAGTVAEQEGVTTATRETFPLKTAAAAVRADEKGVSAVTRPTLALRSASGSTTTDGTTMRQSEETAAAGVSVEVEAAQKASKAARERVGTSTAAALAARRKALAATRQALALRAKTGGSANGVGEASKSRRALVEGTVGRAAVEVKEEGSVTREELPLKDAATATDVELEKKATMVTRPALARVAPAKTAVTAVTREAKEAVAVAAVGGAAAASSVAAGVPAARKENTAVRERAAKIVAEDLAARREAQVRRHALASRSVTGKPTKEAEEETVSRKALVAGAEARTITKKHQEATATREALPLKGAVWMAGVEEEEKEEPVATRPTLESRAASRSSKKKGTTMTRKTQEAAMGTGVAKAAAAVADSSALRSSTGVSAAGDANRAMRERVRAITDEALAARREAMVTRRQKWAPRSAASMKPPPPAALASVAAMTTPPPAVLPPVPERGIHHFNIGTVPAREKQEDLSVPPGQHGWVSPHFYLQPSMTRMSREVATEGASVATAVEGWVAGAAEGGVEETKGEEATLRAEAAMQRAEEKTAAAAASAAAAALSPLAAMATPTPAVLPSVPDWGIQRFTIGTAPAREKQEDLSVPPGQHGWVSPHFYLQPSMTRMSREVATEGASVATAAEGWVAGAAEGGVEETKGEEATLRAEAAMQRAEEKTAAAASAAAAALSPLAAMGTPTPAVLPSVPDWGIQRFTIGTVPAR